MGKFLYVVNYNDDNFSGYSIARKGGGLTLIAGSPFVKGIHPRSVAVARKALRQEVDFY